MTRGQAIAGINRAKALLADLKASNAPVGTIAHQRRNLEAMQRAFARMDKEGRFDDA